MLKLVFLACAVSAHICMIYPPNRGGVDVSAPGEDKCYKKVGPCGGDPAGAPVANLKGGQTLTVTFQQNLNHFNKPVPSSPLQPGYLDLSIAFNSDPKEADFQPWGIQVPDWNAMNQITQTNFSVTAVVPNVDCTNCVLRLRYVSNNAGENDRGEIFYQCSDISISRSTEKAVPKSKPARFKPRLRGGPGKVCCASKQFTAEFEGSSQWRGKTQGTIYYDADRQLMRMDTVVGDGHGTSPITAGTFEIYYNFTDGYQYLYDVNNKSCEPFGLDMWFEWCYGGKDYNQNFEFSTVVGETQCDVWSTGSFRFVDSPATCSPVALFREDSSDLTLYYNVEHTVAQPTVFNLPPECHRSPMQKIASASNEHQYLISLLASHHPSKLTKPK